MRCCHKYNSGLLLASTNEMLVHHNQKIKLVGCCFVKKCPHSAALCNLYLFHKGGKHFPMNHPAIIVNRFQTLVLLFS